MTKCKILLISKINQAIMTWIKILYKPKRNIADGWEEPNYHDFSYPVIYTKQAGSGIDISNTPST
jgi:hypothetical protein